jgi:hypothetical protein
VQLYRSDVRRGISGSGHLLLGQGNEVQQHVRGGIPPRLRRCFTAPALEASTGATPASTAICGTPKPGRGGNAAGIEQSGHGRIRRSRVSRAGGACHGPFGKCHASPGCYARSETGARVGDTT